MDIRSHRGVRPGEIVGVDVRCAFHSIDRSPAHVEKGAPGFERLGLELLQGPDIVHDPDAPAVGGDEEVALPGMDLDVADGDGREVRFIRDPFPASVEAEEQPELRAGKKKVGAGRTYGQAVLETLQECSEDAKKIPSE